MSGELVLVTGGTGHLGFRVLATALESGYKVRAAVRRSEQIEAIKTAPSVQNYTRNLEFVVVPDLIQEDAYEDALKSVKYVIHSASPLAMPTDDYERDIITPAVKGTTGILASALKASTVERVVITSSLTAIVSWEELALVESDKVFTDQSSTNAPTGPYNHPFEAYSASKILALHATNDFIKANKPSFDIINITPSIIIGKNELITNLKDITKGTNSVILAPILGEKRTPNPGSSVYLNDVAKLHVKALDTKLVKYPSYETFMATSEGINGTVYDDAIEIVKKNFPKQVKEGIFSLNGTQPTKKIKVSSEKTEKAFGIKFAGYEEQVNSVVQHYVDLASAA